MKKSELNRVSQRGSLMIEALALLGLITMVTPIMYKKAAERTTELQDINVAAQIRTIGEALDSYVRNNYNTLKTDIAAGTKKNVLASADTDPMVQGIKSFLPSGFDLSNSKFFDASKLQFSIERKETTDMTGNSRSIFTSAVLLPSINNVALNRAAKIASMVGINGGTIKNGVFEGTQGAWRATPADWFNMSGLTLKPGSLMSISTESVAAAASADAAKVLHRVNDGDPEKNTMETNLNMGNNDIKNIASLFGYNGALTIGDDDDNLLINGTTEIKKALTIGGDATLQSDLTVSGNTELGGLKAGATELASLEVTGGTKTGSLEVTNEATIGGTLGVTGDATLEANLAVTGGTTIGGTLGVTGATTLSDVLTVGKTVSINNADSAEIALNVNGGVSVGGKLDVEGLVNANDLHAENSLTVGGTDNLNPTLLRANSVGSTFEVTAGSTSMLLSHTDGVSIENGNSVITMADDEIELSASSGSSVMKMAADGVNVEASGAKLQIGKDSPTAIPEAKMSLGSGEFVIDADSASIKYDSSIVSVENDLITANLGKGGLVLDDTSSQLRSPYDDSSLLDLGENTFDLRNKDSGEANAVSIKGTSDGKIKFFAQNATTDVGNVLIDSDGLAVGTNLNKSGGDRDVTSENIPDQAVIISRKGFIEIAPPSADGTSGKNTGFIKARRLVSDVKYVDGLSDEERKMFDGYTVSGDTVENAYDYYQVNPAYTSVMNDIKLATRGGARLSDILSDYVIKGIYVADNTYHEGEGLEWDVIPIEYGTTKDGVILDADSTSNKTKCEGKDSGGKRVLNGTCEIYSCGSSNCVASPWMGFVPRPQCPKGYQAVVTTTPIRWRMSEVFYMDDRANTWTSDTVPAGYEKIIGDTDSIPYGRGEATEAGSGDDLRFGKYFVRPNNPREAYFKIKESTAEAGSPHDHSVTAKPVTIQTNTWLNTSVSPHEVGTGDDVDIDGWHVLMGFLYRPGDYQTLLEDLGQHEGEHYDMDDIYWNVFPVYAQEMAAIVTTYCSFNRRDVQYDNSGNLVDNWRWGANSEKSPVLNYDQLDPTYYRSGATYKDNLNNVIKQGDRNTLKGEDTRGDTWFGVVNDPSLPYDDAW